MYIDIDLYGMAPLREIRHACKTVFERPQPGSTEFGQEIVKHIVERHRGRLDIASVVGTGTTVSVLLPVHIAGGKTVTSG